MIGALRFEEVGLRRSWVGPLTALFMVGGALLGRTVAWLDALLQASDIDFVLVDTPGTEVAIPLMLLAYVIAAAHVFGRDFSDGTADVALTAPVRREALVVAKLIALFVWALVLAILAAAGDALLRAALAVSTVEPGDVLPAAGIAAGALAAFATLPLVGWVALRFRSTIAAIGAGMGVFVASFLLRGFEIGAMLPWNAPFELVFGRWDVAPIAGPALLMLLGVAACLWQVRRLDLV